MLSVGPTAHNDVYVANAGSTLTVSLPTTQPASLVDLGTIPLNFAPTQLAYSPTYHLLFAREGTTAVAVINTVTKTEISVENAVNSMTDIALSPDGRYLYVADYGGTNIGYDTPRLPSWVERFDASTSTWVAKQIGGIAYRIQGVDDDRFLLIGQDQFVDLTLNSFGATATTTVTQLSKIFQASYYGGFQYDPNTSRIYLGNSGSSSQEVRVYTLSGNSLLYSSTSGIYGTAQGHGGSDVVSPDGAYFYYGSLQILAANITQNVRSLPSIVDGATADYAMTSTGLYSASTGQLAASLPFSTTAFGASTASDEFWAYNTADGKLHDMLVTSSQGVLANDVDPTQQAMTATLLSAPQGSVSFHADGTFSYTPPAGFAGVDTFTYQASDLTNSSAPATVSISVLPSFTDSGNVAVPENSGVQTIPNWITSINGNTSAWPASPSFVLMPSNPALFLVPPAIDSAGNLSFTLAPGAAGASTVSVQLQDVGRTGLSSLLQTFQITVSAINQAPTFQLSTTAINIGSGAAAVSLPGFAKNISPGPPSESGQLVTFHVSVDQPALFSQAPAIDSSGTLTAQAARGVTGTAIVTVTLQDNGGTANGGHDTSAPQTFAISIVAINQAPQFTDGPNETVLNTAGPQAFMNWATNISAGPPSESNQTLTFSLTDSNPSLFSVQPSIGPDGTLRFVPAPGAAGIATIIPTLKDNGGTANGGQDSFTGPSFTITIQASTAKHPLSALPVLNSLLGAPASLYLNFSGDSTSSWGTYTPGVTPAYDQDGDPTTFSDGELQSIQQIWAQVADAFSPFNLNVTTVKPADMSHGKTIEIDIGGSGAWNGATPEGGVAYVGSFTNAALPNLAFVFSVNEKSGDPKDTGIAIEHEAGHAFGLEHQSTYNGTTLTKEYNPGNSAVGPIMGAAYDSLFNRWFDGPDDVSSTTIQDDVAVIAGAANGFGYRPHDAAGTSIATATPLKITGGLVSASGVIEQASEDDFYSFTTAGGAGSINIKPAAFDPTLDPHAVLLDSAGNVVQVLLNDPADGQSWGNASFNLAAGTYYVEVSGNGEYGDLGQYTLTGQIASQATVPDIFAPVFSRTPTTVNLYPALAGYFPAADAAAWSLSYTITADNNPALFQTLPSIDPNTGILSLPIQSGAGGAAVLTIVASDGSYSLQTTLIVATQALPGGQFMDPQFSAASLGNGLWQYGPGGSPWVFDGTAGVSGNYSPITAGNSAAPMGTQVAFVQFTGSMSQMLSLLPGNYTLEFLAAQRGNYTHGGQSLQVLVDGSPVSGSITPAGPNYSLYTSNAFSVTGGLHMITIAGLDPAGGDNTALVDDVTIQSAPGSQLADPQLSAATIGSGNWQYAPTGSPWMFTGTAGVSGNSSPITGGNPAAPQGSQVAFVQFTGSMTQAVTLAAGTYTVDFLAAQRGNYSHGGQSLQVLVNGAPLPGTITPNGGSYSLYASASFTVAAGTHTIAIVGLDPQGGDNTALIDDILVDPVTANQVSDSNFSAGGIGTGLWQYAPANSPWAFLGTAGVAGNYSAITAGNPAAPAGSQVAFLQFTGSISQAMSISAGTYTLDFQAAQRGNYNQGGQSLQVLVDGTAVGRSITPNGTNYASYTSAAFTVAAGTHTITIVGLDPAGGDNTALVDEVSLAPVYGNQFADSNFAAASVGSGSWQYGPTGSPWSFAGTAGISGNYSAITAGNPAAPLGTQVAFVQFTGSMTQSVGLSAGTYTVDFLAAQRGNYNLGGQTLQVLVDGAALGGTITPTGSKYSLYGTASFTVPAGMHTITIAGLNPQGGDNTALVTGVSIQPVLLDQLADPNFAAANVAAGNWQYGPTDSAWYFSGPAGVSGNGSAITAGNPAAPQASQVAFVQLTGSISQALSMAAGTYSIDFQAAQRGNYNFGGQSLQVVVDGSPVGGSITPSGTAYASYNTPTFTVAAGTHIITIVGLDPLGGDNTALVTGVTIVASNSTSNGSSSTSGGVLSVSGGTISGSTLILNSNSYTGATLTGSNLVNAGSLITGTRVNSSSLQLNQAQILTTQTVQINSTGTTFKPSGT